ncbi:hypothetical protein HELRODRAFT_169602 [Helobdella robusta]|uniref:Mannosyltransferase n=1 Tax=Helobdella robusta TaxID=6412 RepID=T1F256_HELRO|nr:hypothetical protein HELRODRAFT_169602 [Helobdella robusta]ESO07899.1 hypothetical protein HELRODRAFT_169602 [Helobdella robusta]
MFENDYWSVLYVLRLILASLPLNGYIHPDEFFQSAELVAGEEFNIQALKTWEFTSKSPIRSRTSMLIMAYLPLSLLKFIHQYMPYFSLVNPTNLLRAYRIWIAVLSCSVDYNVRKILKELNVFPQMYINFCVNVLASSFIMVIFATRTFSNSLELFLFAFLFRISVVNTSNKTIYNAICTSLILTVGVFNRPTFLVFAFIPFIGFLIRNSNLKFLQFLKTIIFTAIFSFLFFVCHVLIDSLYYKTLISASPRGMFNTLTDKGVYYFIKSNLTVTVLNFIKYNTDSDNLATHGIHSRFTHLVVNFPLLFTGLTYFSVYDSFLRTKKSTTVFWWESRKFEFHIAFFSWLVPLFLLSLFPHQEPRFLLPLIVPLVILYASQFYHVKTMFFFMWVLPNLLLILFYGFVHQAGVVQSILSSQRDVVHPSLNSGKTVITVFWHSYMPPRHLFFGPIDECQQFKSNSVKVSVRCPTNFTKLKVFDMKSATEDDLLKRLGKFLNIKKKFEMENSLIENADYFTYNRTVLLYVPGSAMYGSNCTLGHYRFELISSHWPHFSGEKPPTIFALQAINCMDGDQNSRDCPYLPNIFYELYVSSSYNVYNVSLI